MKRTRLLSFLASVAMLMVGLTSCERRVLEDEVVLGAYADVLLLTDWSKLDEQPTGMTAIFYPEDGSSPISVVSNDVERNVVRLRRGQYKVLVFNQSVYEFGSMSFSGMDSFESACATLNELSATSQLTANDYKWYASVVSTDSAQYAMRTPEAFNADRFRYDLTEEILRRQYSHDMGMDGYHDPALEEIYHWYADTIYAQPEPVPPTRYIKARIKGIHNAYLCRAYITNMARADLFGPHVNTQDAGVQVLTDWKLSMVSDDEKWDDCTGSSMGYAQTSFRCFGVPTLEFSHEPLGYSRPFATRALTTFDYGRNYIVIEFLLRDGTTRRIFRFDVTERITYTEDELRLDLELDLADDGDVPIVLPDVPDIIGDAGAGFDATVDPWKSEDHNISF